jgi:hypothetical protein
VRRRATRLTALACAAAALVVAGCGGGDDGGGEETAGPATIVPDDAPAYIEVSIRPEGEARDAAEAAAGKILGTDDPGAKLVALIEDIAADQGSDFSWDEEVAPWLGERVGLFPTSLAGETETGLVFETTDPEKALEFVRTEDNVSGPERDYQGTSFQIDSDGDAFGIVDDFLVSAPPKGFKRIVDSADSASLADSDAYKDAVDGLPDDRLATLYAVPRNFFEAIPNDEIDPEGRRILLKAMGDSADTPVLGDLTASAENLTLELSAAGGDVETEQSSLLSQVPAEAWLALGLGDIGEAIGNGLDSAESAKVRGADRESIISAVEEETGINIEEAAGALGKGALFVQGTTTSDLRGALIVQSSDEQVSADLLDALESLISSQAGGAVQVQSLSPESSTSSESGGTEITQTGFQIEVPDLPQPVQVIQSGNRIIAGYGGGIVGEILNASGKSSGLTGTPAFEAAEGAVGSLGVDAFVALKPVFELADNLGAGDDPGFRQAKPYLDKLDYLTVGSGSEEERTVVRLIIGLK